MSDLELAHNQIEQLQARAKGQHERIIFLEIQNQVKDEMLAEKTEALLACQIALAQSPIGRAGR